MVMIKTKENDMLDAICWQHYGYNVVEEVLKANPGLARYEDCLPAGIFINLPDIRKPPKQMIRLWD